MIPQSHVPRVSALKEFLKENMLRTITLAMLMPLSVWLFVMICETHQSNPLKASYKYTSSYTRTNASLTSVEPNKLDYQYDGSSKLFISHRSMKPFTQNGELIKNIKIRGNLIVIEEIIEKVSSRTLYNYHVNYAVSGIPPDQYILRVVTRDGDKTTRQEFTLDLTNKLVNYLVPSFIKANKAINN